MELPNYVRPVVSNIRDSLQHRPSFLHILIGPRQVGKSTGAQQIAQNWLGPVVYASADQPIPPGPEYIQTFWEKAIGESKKSSDKVLLIIDEIQKIRGWSEAIKAHWDRNVYAPHSIQVLLLGSSSLLIQKGLSESLTGRFLLYKMGHWGFTEMHDAFSWDLEEWLFFGGYPGSVTLADDENMWKQYIRDSLIETVLARDILQLQTVTKPSLLRHLFFLSTSYPSQVLSYNKMLGQLQEAGNTTTLAHYLTLFNSAFLVSGISGYRKGVGNKRGSSPKLVLWNNALVTASDNRTFSSARTDTAWWGRLVENAVGASLLNAFRTTGKTIFYWKDRNAELDFVVETSDALYGIEVKSTKPKRPKGLQEFLKRYPEAHPIIIGPGGYMDFEEFFRADPNAIFR